MSPITKTFEKTALQWGEYLVELVQTLPFEEEQALHCVKKWAQQCKKEGLDVNLFRIRSNEYEKPIPLAQHFIKSIKEHLVNDQTGILADPAHSSVWPEICEKVLSAIWSEGVDVDNEDKNPHAGSFNAPVLHLACRFHLNALMECCLNRGASVKAYAANGTTVLMSAALTGNILAIKRLIGLGADLHARRAKGVDVDLDLDQTAVLTYALESRSAETVQLLLSLGANPYLQDCAIWTTLDNAVYGKDISIMKIIIQAGVDLNALNGQGETSCHCAAESNLLEQLQCLVEAGADFQKKNTRGETPLECAQKKYHFEIVNYLLEVQNALKDKAELNEILLAKPENVKSEKEEASPIQRNRI